MKRQQDLPLELLSPPRLAFLVERGDAFARFIDRKSVV